MSINRIALVTGGSRGLGRAIIIMLIKEDYKVAFTYHKNEVDAQNICERFGDKVFSIKADASDFTMASEVIGKALEKFQRIDVLINNVALAKDKPIWSIEEVDWDFTMNNVLKPTFNYTRAIVQHFIDNNCGKIINIGSINGIRGREGSIGYSTAKAGVIGFTKTLAKELGKYNITANVVAPGYIDTDGQINTSELIKKMVLDECYIRKLTQPDQVANLVSFLASEKSSNITGQVIQIDCGQYI